MVTNLQRFYGIQHFNWLKKQWSLMLNFEQRVWYHTGTTIGRTCGIHVVAKGFCKNNELGSITFGAEPYICNTLFVDYLMDKQRQFCSLNHSDTTMNMKNSKIIMFGPKMPLLM
jgi:hypothetical protein